MCGGRGLIKFKKLFSDLYCRNIFRVSHFGLVFHHWEKNDLHEGYPGLVGERFPKLGGNSRHWI